MLYIDDENGLLEKAPNKYDESSNMLLVASNDQSSLRPTSSLEDNSNKLTSSSSSEDQISHSHPFNPQKVT